MFNARPEVDAALPELFEQLGEPIVIYGEPFDCEVTAIVSLEDDIAQAGGGKSQNTQGRIFLRSDDAFDLTVLHQLSIDGKRFAVTSIGAKRADVVEVSVARTQREITTVNALDGGV